MCDSWWYAFIKAQNYMLYIYICIYINICCYIWVMWIVSPKIDSAINLLYLLLSLVRCYFAIFLGIDCDIGQIASSPEWWLVGVTLPKLPSFLAYFFGSNLCLYNYPYLSILIQISCIASPTKYWFIILISTLFDHQPAFEAGTHVSHLDVIPKCHSQVLHGSTGEAWTSVGIARCNPSMPMSLGDGCVGLCGVGKPGKPNRNWKWFWDYWILVG